MLSSISPVGEASRRQRWWLTATAHLLASLVGGTASGLALGTLGWLLVGRGGAPAATAAMAVLGGAALAGAAIDLRERRLPSWRRQVDERWLTTYRGWVYGAGYGIQLGAGAVTIVASTSTYLAGLAALLTTDPALGALVGAVFGTVRATPLLLTARVTDPGRLARVLRRVAAARGAARLGAAGAQGAVGVLALAWAAGA